MPTTAKVICDSTSENGVRLTTLVLEYPRIIHSEFMTHRMFSRNASSSRAIPVEKQIERVENDPFVPTYWGANQKGMQAVKQCDNKIIITEASSDVNWEDYEYTREEYWYQACDAALTHAENFLKAGYHKQLVNRLLEPFSHIQVVVTATEWEGFFAQRLHPAAQPEIQELARVMKEAMDSSTSDKLNPGEWHLPFTEVEDIRSIYTLFKVETSQDLINIQTQDILRKISVARCARVSYGLNDRGWGDIEKDLALYDMLLAQWHFSPFEHQATPMTNSNAFDRAPSYSPMEVLRQDTGTTHMDLEGDLWSGNFKSWVQNRQLIQQNA